MQGPRPSAQALRLAACVVGVLLAFSGCDQPAQPQTVSLRTTQPPWDAPRDAATYIKAAGLKELPVSITENQGVFQLTITIDGKAVAIPAYIGIDRVRAVQAAVHTHDGTGTIWLEGPDSEALTLGQFFTLWGVRFDSSCLGAACGGVTVTATPATKVGDPRGLRLVHLTSITVTAHTG